MIPEGWREKQVAEVLDIDNTKRKPISAEERAKIPGRFPYYGPTQAQDWIDHYAYDGTYALIGEDGDHFLKYRTLSMTQLVHGKFNVNNHAHAIRGTDACEADWFYYYFQNRDLREHLTRQGAKRYKLTKASLEKIPLLVPPSVERVEIISILRTWDHAIKMFEALIANAQTQKQAVMQKLLSGNHRLPGFSKPWEWADFADVFGRVKTKNTEGNTNVLTISAQHGLISQVEYFNKSVASDDVRGYTLLQHGDFAYNKSYSDGYPMGAIKPLDRYDSGIVSSLYICFRLTRRGFDHDFFRHYFEAGLFNREIAAIAQEGARNHGLLNVSVVEFFETSLHIPQPEEQAAIAKIINAAEAEEQAYQAQLTALRQEKAALMQQLLTGKRRVKLPESELG